MGGYLSDEQRLKKNKARQEQRRAKAASEGRTLRSAPNGKTREENRAAKKLAKASVMVMPKIRTGTREYRRAVQFKFGGGGDMTKSEMRAMLSVAAANTAAMPVEGL